ncbi:hypothetical protein FQZ97_987400 [compost metagenome]
MIRHSAPYAPPLRRRVTSANPGATTGCPGVAADRHPAQSPVALADTAPASPPANCDARQTPDDGRPRAARPGPDATVQCPRPAIPPPRTAGPDAASGSFASAGVRRRPLPPRPAGPGSRPRSTRPAPRQTAGTGCRLRAPAAPATPPRRRHRPQAAETHTSDSSLDFLDRHRRHTLLTQITG